MKLSKSHTFGGTYNGSQRGMQQPVRTAVSPSVMTASCGQPLSTPGRLGVNEEGDAASEDESEGADGQVLRGRQGGFSLLPVCVCVRVYVVGGSDNYVAAACSINPSLSLPLLSPPFELGADESCPGPVSRQREAI